MHAFAVSHAGNLPRSGARPPAGERPRKGGELPRILCKTGRAVGLEREGVGVTEGAQDRWPFHARRGSMRN